MDFKCKYCGSVNLELEEKGNQTGLYCCDCGKWLKWLTKEEKRVFNNKNGCKPFYVPKGATNGDMIKAMFPNVEVNVTKYSYVVEVKLPYHTIHDTGLLFDKNFWNAPYKNEVENDTK